MNAIKIALFAGAGLVFSTVSMTANAQTELLAQLTPRITELKSREFNKIKLNVTLALKKIPEKPETEIIRRQLRIVQLLADGASVLEKNDLSRAARKKKIEEFFTQFRAMGAELKFHDTPVLVAIVQASPICVKPYARQWLQKSRRQAAEIKSVSEYLQAMALPDRELRRLATARIATILAKSRYIVDRGGRLSKSQRLTLSSRVLIETLISQLAREENNSSVDDLDSLALAQNTLNAKAIHALVLIEEPALTPLEAASSAEVRRAKQALVVVQKARQERLQKYPESDWFQATQPQVSKTDKNKTTTTSTEPKEDSKKQ